jgi:hypothetical protein
MASAGRCTRSARVFTRAHSCHLRAMHRRPRGPVRRGSAPAVVIEVSAIATSAATRPAQDPGHLTQAWPCVLGKRRRPHASQTCLNGRIRAPTATPRRTTALKHARRGGSLQWTAPATRHVLCARSRHLCDCVRDVQKQARRFSCMHASDHAHTLIMPSLNNVRACAEIFHLFSRSPSLLVAPATPPSRRTPSGRCRVPRQRAYMSQPLLRPVRCLLVSK